MQQCFYDVITRESEKLVGLNNSYEIEMEQRSKEKHVKEKRVPYYNEQAVVNETRERLAFQEELEKEAKEKELLLQATINEAKNSGYPLPPSLIRLMNSQNGISIHIYLYNKLY